jgi:hypothetical protein
LSKCTTIVSSDHAPYWPANCATNKYTNNFSKCVAFFAAVGTPNSPSVVPANISSKCATNNKAFVQTVFAANITTITTIGAAVLSTFGTTVSVSECKAV